MYRNLVFELVASWNNHQKTVSTGESAAYTSYIGNICRILTNVHFTTYGNFNVTTYFWRAMLNPKRIQLEIKSKVTTLFPFILWNKCKSHRKQLFGQCEPLWYFWNAFRIIWNWIAKLIIQRLLNRNVSSFKIRRRFVSLLTSIHVYVQYFHTRTYNIIYICVCVVLECKVQIYHVLVIWRRRCMSKQTRTNGAGE